MIPALEKLVENLLKLTSNVHTFVGLYYLRLALSVALVGLSVTSLVKSRREGYRAVDAAIDRLKAYIRGRYEQSELMTAKSLRTLAHSIQRQMRCPPLTDGAIAEAIRSVALEIEDAYKGAALKRRLEALNEPLKELDLGGGALLCLATVDRMVAYFMTAEFGLRSIAFCQLVIEVIVFAVALLLIHASPAILKIASYPTLLLWIFPALYIRHAFMALRAGLYWRSITYEQTEQQVGVAGRGWFSWIKLNPRLDPYAYPIQSGDTRSLETDWAPNAEKWLILRSGFVEAHQYKYFEVRDLERKLLHYREHLGAIDAKTIKVSANARRCVGAEHYLMVQPALLDSRCRRVLC